MTGENISFTSENDYSKKEIVRLIRKNINIAIADKNNTTDEQFKTYQIEILVKNFNCHLNSIFHDINLNLPDEFLKRYFLDK
jgi:tRNA splicing ligase